MNRNASLKTPWTTGGNLLHSTGDPKGTDDEGNPLYPDVGEWRGNDVFEATLKFRGTERGRSAAFFRWENLDTHQHYPMFISDVGRMITQGMTLGRGGVVSGRWFVVKRGGNYGITPQDATTETTEAP